MSMRRILAPVGYLIGPLLFGALYLLLRLVNGGRRLIAEVDHPSGEGVSVVYMIVPRSRCLLATAMTLGKRIYIRGEEISPALLKHELVHVRQWKRYGALGFAARYGYEMIRRGRAGNLLETEARIAAPGTY